MTEVPAASPAHPSSSEGDHANTTQAPLYPPAPPIGPAYAASAEGPSTGPATPVGGTALATPAPPSASPPTNGWSAWSTATPTPPATPTPQRRRGRWLWWTAGSLAFTALVGLSAYLIVVANQWSSRVDELTTISADLGQQVAEQAVALESAQNKAATAQSQLDTATARITDLANEEANATDHEGVWINLVDAMADCADGRQDLIDVLTNSDLYFPGKTNAQYESELTTYCDGVTADYADFKTEIGK